MMVTPAVTLFGGEAAADGAPAAACGCLLVTSDMSVILAPGMSGSHPAKVIPHVLGKQGVERLEGD